MIDKDTYGLGPYRDENFVTFAGKSLFVHFHGPKVSKMLEGLSRKDILKVRAMLQFERAGMQEIVLAAQISDAVPLSDGSVKTARDIRGLSVAISHARILEAVLYLEDIFAKRKGRLDSFDRIPSEPEDLKKDVMEFVANNFAQMLVIRGEQKFAASIQGSPILRKQFALQLFTEAKKICGRYRGFRVINQRGDVDLAQGVSARQQAQKVIPDIDRHTRDVILPELGFRRDVRMTIRPSQTRHLRRC